MLDALRKSTGGWIAKIFIALLVLSFAVWGIADIFGGYGRETLISVGDTRISAEEYRMEVDREVQMLGQQMGQPLSLQQARQFGVDNRVMSRLVTEAILDENARNLGLGASDQSIARLIMEDTAFHTAEGRFDRQYFTQILRQAGLDEEDYVASQRGAVLRQQLAQGLVGATPAPDVLSEAMHRYQNERRSVDYILLGEETAGDIPAPQAAALNEYFEENRSRYRAPEYRNLRVLVLDAEALADTVEVSEEEAREAYEREIERYTRPERRELEQIMFASAEEAREARQSIDDGDLFEQVATQRGVRPDDYRLGMRTREQIVDPAVAEAAFSLDPGTVSQPVEGRFGASILRVVQVEAEETQSFTAVEEDVRRQVATDRANESLIRIYDEIEDQLAGGSTLEEAARVVGLAVREIEAVDADGNAPDGSEIDLPEADAILERAFETDIGVEPEAVRLGDDGYAWAEVVDMASDRDRELDEVRERVVEDWRDDETRRRLTAAAGEIAQALRDGRDLQEIAEERGLEVSQAGPMRRNERPDALSTGAVSAIFATRQGDVSSAPAQNAGQRVVFRVTEVAVPAREEVAQEQRDAIRERLAAGLADDLLTQYVNRMRDEFGVTINQTALNRITGAS